MEVGVFARYLRQLAGRLDRGGGWYGVFWQRDPDGLAACLQGAEIPPWDVVESLLQDLPADGGETVRARALHSAAAAAHDRLSGGPEALQERLELMRREQAYAEDRAQELLHRLAALPEGTPQYQHLANELSWTNDDHTRATARCAELSARLAALTPAAAAGERAEGAAHAPGGRPASALPAAWFRLEDADTGAPAASPVGAPGVAHGPSGGGRGEERKRPGRKRRPRGARYAWLDEGGDGDEGEDEAVGLPGLPVAEERPRGARFGGGEDRQELPPQRVARGRPGAEAVDAESRRAAAETVVALVQLRAEGRGGEAHAVLCEAAARPAAWLPVLASELHRAGLGADWATLLWEAASLPPGQLAAAAGALAAAGRAEDCGHLLRQGVARPAAEIADAVLALGEAGGHSEAEALLRAFVRARSPEDAAQLAAPDPRRLVPQLLLAARAVSPERERDLVHALRVAGIMNG
ncbi:UL36 very large tegument protein [Streptomyces sp. NPDC059909]|uniref:UL36 very large tegument protein n=1 Tax=Streptomyces sp. NPDC059909 TaxID=3346998 RepID=UPI003665B9DB